MAGEHGLWEKNTWHEGSNRVPFFVSLPDERFGGEYVQGQAPDSARHLLVDYPRYDVNHNTSGPLYGNHEYRIVTNTIYHHADHPMHVELPWSVPARVTDGRYEPRPATDQSPAVMSNGGSASLGSGVSYGSPPVASSNSALAVSSVSGSISRSWAAPASTFAA